MACFLHTHVNEPDFAARFETLLGMKREQDADVDAVVAQIIADVRARGDAAVLELTEKFDRQKLTPETMRISAAEIDAAEAACPPATLAALQLAADRIADFHARQKPVDDRLPILTGLNWVIAGRRWMLPVFMCRAGWPIILLSADERHSGARCRCRARGDGGADAGRAVKPVSAGGGAAGRC